MRSALYVGSIEGATVGLTEGTDVGAGVGFDAS